MKFIDTSLTKVVDIDGTNVTIKPLTPNQRRKAMLTWWGVLSSSKKDDDTFITITNVDRDELAKLILPAVVKIDRTNLPARLKKLPILDLLIVAEDEDFWKLALLIIPNTGMDEEEVKNSDSSSEQGSPESKGDAGKPVEMVDELASTTPTA